MNKDFVPYEQSRKLSELGFNELCIKQYSHDGWLTFCVNDWGQPRPETGREIDLASAGLQIAAPLYQQAFRWFREKYGLYADVFIDDDKTFGFCICSFIEEGVLEKPITRKINSHEEAELECLKKLIEIVKK